MNVRHRAGLWVCLVAAVPLIGAALRDFPPAWDREAAVENGWIYDDWDAGLAQAKESGRPLMVVLRCPP
ncbi:MAG: hypothetical protein KDC38_07385 [Planctomycetes bacterium]|nr:hypothetical protein [Planctomycetota bacterium]